MKTLVLGIGNDILSDDGIGTRLVNDLKKSYSGNHLCFDSTITGGLDMLHLIKNYDQLVVIDGIKTAEGKPGTVKYFSLQQYPPTLHLNTFHDSHFKDVVQLARNVGIAMPDKIWIITVEIFDDITFRTQLSPTLENMYHQIFAVTKSIIEKLKIYKAIINSHETI